MPESKKRDRRIVMTFGTFDIFHKGHESYLRQAKKFGDCLIVVVARDKTVKKIKGKLPKNDEKSRLRTVKQSAMADEAVLGGLSDKYAVIRKHKPDVICLGYDQIVDEIKLTRKLKSFGLKSAIIKRLRPYRPEMYKSSKLNLDKS